MAARHVETTNARALTLGLLSELLGGTAGRSVGVRLWDGTRWPDDAPRPATLVLKHPGALRAMFLPGSELALAEAYLYDDFDIEGDIEAAFDLADALTRAAWNWHRRLWVVWGLLGLPISTVRQHSGRGPAKLAGVRHSSERDRQAISYHYDVSNDFYALWLDWRMIYSCAYFQQADEELDIAQEHKLDYICRKLRLKPGQRLLDLGCGWGGLLMYAAERYGVQATGITLSEPQAELANARIAAAGLSERARVFVHDYRGVDEPEGYDALVSVGMGEHVGTGNLPAFFAQTWRLLRPGGVFLNHGIANRRGNRWRWRTSFSEAYVFPDGELAPLNITLRAAEKSGFEVRDVESLREHYALTLRHWVRRLEAQHDEVLQFVDEPTYRVWRLFMAGSAHGLMAGRLNVYQTLLLKPDKDGWSGLPLTREDWYA